MKTCCKCKEEKPYNQFYRLKSSTDGFKRRCKECDAYYSTLRYLRNPEPQKQAQKRYYQKKKLVNE